MNWVSVFLSTTAVISAALIVSLPAFAEEEPVLYEFTATLSGTKLGPTDTEATPFGPALFSFRVFSGVLYDQPGSPLTLFEIADYEVELQSVASGVLNADGGVGLYAVDCCPGTVELRDVKPIIGITSYAIIAVDLGLFVFDSGSFSGDEVVINDFQIIGEEGVVDVEVSEATDVRFRIIQVPEVASGRLGFVALVVLVLLRRRALARAGTNWVGDPVAA